MNLLTKLNAAGIGPIFLNFLESYLVPRQGRVVIQGESSDYFEIQDSIFQDTVLGVLFWNQFFRDIIIPANERNGHETIIADILNIFHKYHRHNSVCDRISDLMKYRDRILSQDG